MRFLKTLPFGRTSIKSKTKLLSNKEKSFALASLSLFKLLCVYSISFVVLWTCALLIDHKWQSGYQLSQGIYWQCMCNTAEDLLTSYMRSMWVHSCDSIKLGKPLGNFHIHRGSISDSLISIIASLALDWGPGMDSKELCTTNAFSQPSRLLFCPLFGFISL